MRTPQLTVVLLVGALTLGVRAQQTTQQQPAGDWQSHGRDAGAARFSPLTQITTENVSQLQLAWTYDTKVAVPPPPGRGGGAAGAGDPEAGPARGRGAGPAGAAGPGGAAGRGAAPASVNRQSASTPLVIDGIMYLGTAYNRVVALDPVTGKELWVKDVGAIVSRRGVSWWPGDADHAPRLIVGTEEGWFAALDPRTGEYIESFGNGGRVAIRDALAPEALAGRLALSSPPAIYKHLLITGNGAQESPSLGPPSDIHAWDARTGKHVWTFHTIPRPGEPNHEAWQGDQWVNRAGANAWGLITVDEERGIVYLPLGTPATDFYGADRLGSNLYGSSLVALDAETGKLKWYFQTVHHDNWDYDLTSPPQLIDVRQNGQTIPAVAQYTKQGLLFIFNRVTGEPVFGVEERPVVSDNPLPGDAYSPTQPFPLKPAPIARMTFSPEEVATVTPEHEAFCRGLLALEGGAMTGGPFAQYGPRLRVIFPGWTGGANWNGGAFVPDLGYLILPTQDHGMLNKMVQSPNNPNMYVRRGPDGAPPGVGTNFHDGQKGWPCQQPPWGELVAVNVNTGDIAWRVPLGSFEELDAKGIPATGTLVRGGAIATAGGVVFIAASQDAKFRAFDARTGKTLWETNLTENGRAVPITFMGKNGKQYVAVMAGGGNPVARQVDQNLLGGRLHVYALPDAPRSEAAPSTPVPAQAANGTIATSTPAVAAAAAASHGATASALPAGTGRDVVERVCSECHTVEEAITTKWSRARWSSIVEDMVGRGAVATDEELHTVIDYLTKYFGTE